MGREGDSAERRVYGNTSSTSSQKSPLSFLCCALSHTPGVWISFACCALSHPPRKVWRNSARKFVLVGVLTCGLPYTWYDGGVYHTLLGRFSKTRLLDNGKGANTERYVCGKLSARRFPTPTFFWRRQYDIPTVEVSTMKIIGTGGCDIHTVVYGIR